jgi:hypothetical protein
MSEELKETLALIDQEFEEFPENEPNKHVVAGPVYVCSLLDKNAKRLPLLKMHGVLYANGMLIISEDPGSPCLKTIDLKDAKVTQTETILKDFQRKQFKTKPLVCLIDLIHPDQHGKFPTLPGLGLVFGSELPVWHRALVEAAGTFKENDQLRFKAKRWARRFWRGLTGGLVESEVAASYTSDFSRPQEQRKTGFRTFEEYLSASVEDRHREPPSVTEFDSVVEFVGDISETSQGWSVCTDKEEVFALKSLDLDTGNMRVITTGLLQGIPADVALKYIYDAETRASWDPLLRFFHSLPTSRACLPTEGTADVIFVCLNMPFGVEDRELLAWRLMRKVGDDYHIYVRSCEREQAPEVARGRVRADVIASVYVIKSLPGGNSELVYFTQLDLKGSIPKMIINSLATSAALPWIRKLRSACQDFLRS